MDPLQVAVAAERRHAGREGVGIDTQHLRIGESAIPVAIEHPRGRPVFRRRLHRSRRLHVVDGTQRCADDVVAQHVDGHPVRQVDVVDRRMMAGRVVDCGRMPAEGIAKEREHTRLVERCEPLDAIAEAARDEARIVGEPAGAVPVDPATGLLKSLRKIPVVEADPGFDADGEQTVDQPVVEFESGLVRLPPAGGKDTRPGDREPVGAHAQLPHQRDVLAIAVIVIAGHVARIAIGDPALLAAERIPDALAAPAFPGGAFDLVRRGRDAPDEIGAQQAVCLRRGWRFCTGVVDEGHAGLRA